MTRKGQGGHTLNREQALQMLKQHLSNENHISHSLAVEAIMRGLAERLGEDVDKYGLAGLLHGIDYDATGEDPQRHSLVGADPAAGGIARGHRLRSKST